MADLISRQAAIDALHMHLMYRMGTDSNKKRLDDWINSLPSAQPEPMKINIEDFNKEDWERLKKEWGNTPITVLPSAQPEPHWIPCSERLPEEKERSYWVCLETGGQCQCRWTNDMYGLGANKWSKWGWHIMDKPQYSKIVAWMPLPEPYKERREE